jgi:hypothetical protein
MSLRWMMRVSQSSPPPMNLQDTWQGVVRPPLPLDPHQQQGTLLPLLQRGVSQKEIGQRNDLPLLAFSPTMGFVSTAAPY